MASMTKGTRRQNDVIMWENRMNNSEMVFGDFYKEIYRNQEFYRGMQIGYGDWASEIAFDSISSFAKSGRVLVINKILTNLAAQNSAIMWRRPWHYLRARRVSGLNDERARWTAEHALNACLGDERNAWLKKNRLNLLMAEMGVGVLKATNIMEMTGKDPAAGRKDRYGEVVITEDPETGESIPSFVGGIPRLNAKGEPIQKGNKFLIDDRRLSDYYRTDFVHPFLMRFDPEGGNDHQDHAWICENFSLTYNEFMDVPFFDHKHRAIDAARVLDKNLLSRRTRRYFLSGKGGMAGGFNPTNADKDLLRFFMVACWDIQKREIVYLLDGFNKVIAKIKYPSYIDISPYSISKLHEDPGEFQPVVEVTQARPLARAYNEMHSMLLTHAARFTRRYIAREGMFRENEREKFKSNDDGNVIYYKRQYGSGDLKAVEDARLDPAIYRNMAIYTDDMDKMMGSSQNSQAAGSGVESATEAAIVENRTSNRDTDKRNLIAEPAQHHAGIILRMMQDTLPDDILINSVGPDAVTFQKNVRRPQLAGDFSVFIEIGEMEPHDQRIEKADLNEIVQIVGPAVLLSPTFSKKFWESRRMFDPQLVKEVQQIVQDQLMAQAQGADGGEQQGDKGGGAKPTKATEKTEKQGEGRSAGRAQRKKKKEE
jgi:hypothetical protein